MGHPSPSRPTRFYADSLGLDHFDNVCSHPCGYGRASLALRDRRSRPWGNPTALKGWVNPAKIQTETLLSTTFVSAFGMSDEARPNLFCQSPSKSARPWCRF
jgi:hypothetical protein